VRIVSVGSSDVGRVREKNEDSFLIRDDLGLYVVADGMGGHLGGQMASRLAVEGVGSYVEEQIDGIREEPADVSIQGSSVPRVLAEAVRSACGNIFSRAQSDPELRGMGTTVTCMLVTNQHAYLAHVGDSRCYLQRDEHIVQVTDDHSLVNEQVKAGLLSEEEARASHLKNIITRSVGFERDVAVDTFALPLQIGDKILMCSDGLANLVDDTEIGLALANLGLDEVPQTMIDLANERGGDDNITVVCIVAEPETEG
jgi:protein phosphatase